MKIDYKKKIEKMKKELQSVQVAITEPDLIFIDYVEEGKYKIDYRFVGGSAVYFWDKLRDYIIPEGYKGMVLGTQKGCREKSGISFSCRSTGNV